MRQRVFYDDFVAGRSLRQLLREQVLNQLMLHRVFHQLGQRGDVEFLH